MSNAQTHRLWCKLDIIVLLLASAIVINSQFPAFANKYLIDGDVPQHIYWMQQFYDRDLFNNDLLSQYAIHLQPWGFALLYRILSYIIHPLMISKILPIALFAFSALYTFRLVRHFTNNYTGFLAALLFMTIPFFLNIMLGGHARSFAFLLIISFLYYLIKNNYKISSILLLLQALFYPMIFFVAATTYLFSFIGIRNQKISLELHAGKAICYIVAIIASTAVLSTKHIFMYNQSLGSVVIRNQMLDNPEYYRTGRYRILPPTRLQSALVSFAVLPLRSYTDSIIGFHPKATTYLKKITPHFVNRKLLYKITLPILLILMSYLVLQIFKRKIWIPKELLYLAVASAVWYQVANMFLLKLFIPDRYLLYTFPLLTVIITSVAISTLVM